LAVHPTRGMDVGAIEYVHGQIIKQRDRGCAVLLISTELEEIMALSDRIGVMYAGEMIGVIDAKQADINDVGLMMTGGANSQTV
jgi:ABC-type uncharacterized transport system ATPase subunit